MLKCQQVQPWRSMVEGGISAHLLGLRQLAEELRDRLSNAGVQHGDPINEIGHLIRYLDGASNSCLAIVSALRQQYASKPNGKANGKPEAKAKAKGKGKKAA